MESIDWQIIPVTDQVKDDPSFAPVTQKYGGLLKTLEQPVGRTDVELDIKSANVRTQETNMADFVADAFRKATGADVALVNGGSLRADTIIKPGILTKRDVLSILPFNNRVVKVQVSGAVIRAALEHGVESLGQELQPGRFPQVSGIRFAFDANRKPGARLTSVTVNGKVLDDRRNYTLATTSYVAVDFGDGYRFALSLGRRVVLRMQLEREQCNGEKHRSKQRKRRKKLYHARRSRIVRCWGERH